MKSMTNLALHFTKMNGAGNDFVMVDNRSGEWELSGALIARLCDRHRGVGADGLILLETGEGAAPWRMRYHNADGGEAEMCGNGARCFARFAARVADLKGRVRFETLAGVIEAELLEERVRLAMSVPHGEQTGLDLVAGGCPWKVHFLNTGVPHAVVFVDAVEEVDVARVGRTLRQHEAFAPSGTNVNFAARTGERHYRIRTYERGVEAETLACGTGVVATALLADRLEKCGSPVAVRVAGGDDLEVAFERTETSYRAVTLTGPADFVFEGVIDV